MDNSTAATSRSKRKSIAHIPSGTAVGKDNATTDIAALQRAESARSVLKKKSRGKSLGPGGLEALKETSGNATKIDATIQIRSILKPAIPLTPPKVIPSFDELRQRSTRKRSPAKSGAEELLIDFSTPAASRTTNTQVAVTGSEKVIDPFSPARPMTDGPDAMVEDDDEVEARHQAQKKAALDRRAERRKSMANRRVSFAPEATLHTWSVMELAEDSTTSSASNSTRRQSSMTAEATPKPQSFSPERPATPEEQVDELQVEASPAHQRDLHQRKHRRSSTAPVAQLEGSLEEVLSSSPSGDIMTESSPVRIDDSVGSDTDDDTDGDTAMSMDDPTSQSVVSENSTSSQGSLDERLRQAANLAGTRGIDYDENGEDLSMEMATSTVTNAFQPWAANNRVAPESTAMLDQENAPFVSTANEQQSERDDPDDGQDDTQDMSMDVTSAVGGILSKGQPSANRRKSVASRRRSVARRRSSGVNSENDDSSMDFTAVGGQILTRGPNDDNDGASDEDLTMEFTSVVGGVLGQPYQGSSPEKPEADETMDLTGNMDMTVAYGGILPPIEEQTEPVTDAEDTQTAPMDMTKAVGNIFQSKAPTQKATPARDQTLTRSTLTDPRHAGVQSQAPVTSIASETGSPDITLKPRLSGRSRKPHGPSTTPKFSPKRISPVRNSPMKLKAATPTKQLTPLPARVATQNKTPVNTAVDQKTASPKRLFQDEIKARQSPALARNASPGKTAIFSQDMPSVILSAVRPQLTRKRSSGIGIDQEGFGSPRVAEMLNRRSSIVDSAAEFKLDVGQRSRLRFEDPQELAREVDAERAEEERRESGRFIMEQEADAPQQENTTMNLSQMIESMTPRKEPKSRLKGRKSLAVGAARGLLGKRPAELDLDEEDSPSSPKRLRAISREGSPVKKVHLPRPPSKEEITGRLTRAEQVRLNALAGPGSTTPAASPPKKSATSPHPGPRYKDLPLEQADERPESFVDKLDNVMDAVDISIGQDAEKESISLQNFLNMTNIHFIELSTTKRRHTQAPAPQRPSQEQEDRSTEAQFAAASTTLPLIELYQHATRELKRNISDGRRVIRSIEAETLHEQPALFREYVDARPEVRAVMDNQFRNGKTNARLQSKEIWYTWRGQLVSGLKSGLDDIAKGLQGDDKLLEEQQRELDQVLPALQEQHSSLSEELLKLQELRADLDNVDMDALEQTRKELKAADEEHARKSALLDELKQQMREKEEALEAAEDFKVEMSAQIEEADRVRQEYRGWPVADVLALQSRVESIEKQTSWKLITAEDDTEDPNEFGGALTLSFRDQLRLFFYPSAYETSSGGGKRRSGRKSKSVSGPTAPISLTYSPMNYDGEVVSGAVPSTQNRFFLQLIRSQLHTFSMMPKRSVAPKVVLGTVSRGWTLASQVSEEIRMLNMTGVTTVQILGDEKLGARTKLVFPGGSRIDVEFELCVNTLNDGEIASSTAVSAKGIYGPKASLVAGSKGRKVQVALTKEVESKDLGSGAWISAIHAFEQWLDGQVEKQQEKVQQKSSQKQTIVKAVEPVEKSSELPLAAPILSATTAIEAAATQLRTEEGTDAQAIPQTASRDLRRSPLAPKSKNVPTAAVQKKLPVPSKRFVMANAKLSQFSVSQQQQQEDTGATTAAAGKENVIPSSLAAVSLAASKLQSAAAGLLRQPSNYMTWLLIRTTLWM
ncbi:Kinetochore protein spc7 [Cyphellophora attinorum]|uniref:Kinetochore protein spc7 n=1 Tax=Cyphellophora attinorum TaxID=1664694 RepID=A0A0N0NM00_9EURO|nr:Kinetochore protein spc7 [Phialophora attinorum]KPI39629.1 Kinetochore protein spc7 [Phialophora attinorum]